MFIGNGEDLMRNLMKLQSDCPNCGTALTFEDSARLGRDNGVSENAIMCHKCRKVFNVNILPDEMQILDELTKYDFSDPIKGEETGKEMAAAPVIVSEKPETDVSADVSQKPVTEVKEVVPADVSGKPVGEIKENVSADVSKKPVGEVKSAAPGIVQQNAVSQTPPVQKQIKSGGLSDNSIVRTLFYKTDAQYGLPRLSKTKIFSALWFALMFSIFLITLSAFYGYVEFSDVIISLISALICTVPVFVIGWLIARYLDGKAKKEVPAAGNYPQIDKQYAPVGEVHNNLKCPGCGSEVAEGSRFCPHCGEKISKT